MSKTVKRKEGRVSLILKDGTLLQLGDWVPYTLQARKELIAKARDAADSRHDVARAFISVRGRSTAGVATEPSVKHSNHYMVQT